MVRCRKERFGIKFGHILINMRKNGTGPQKYQAEGGQYFAAII
jgi:hypothetical protein